MLCHLPIKGQELPVRWHKFSSRPRPVIGKFRDVMMERKLGLQAQTRTLLLVLVFFLLGLALGAYWFYRATNPSLPNIGEIDHTLSESTRTLLKTLEAPVKIRYYSLLDPATTSDSLRAFADRVDQLLSKYEHEAGGKITVTRYAKLADAAAASAVGVKAFNLAEGDPCFLGVAVACNDQKETMGQLSPEWEAALESDLTRAISRVTAASPARRATPTSESPPDAAVVAEVRRLIPNLGSVSLADGKQILRDAALKEIKEATDETQQRVKEAQQRINQAQTGGSEAEQQAALKQLQQVQTEQTEQLKELAARAEVRIQALEQIKSK